MLRKYLNKLLRKENIDFDNIIPKELNDGTFLISNTIPEMQTLLKDFENMHNVAIDFLHYADDLRDYMELLKKEQEKLPVTENLDVKDELEKKYTSYLSQLNEFNNSINLLYDKFWETVIDITSPKQSMGINDEDK